MPDMQRTAVSLHGRMLQLFKGILRADGGHISGHMFDGLVTSTAQGLTATAGGVQATSQVLSSAWNQFTTVASAADGATLPVGVQGVEIVVVNDAVSNAMQVFGNPLTGDTIDAVATATGVAVSAAKRTSFRCILSGTVAEGTQAAVAGKWVSLQGVKSV